ncbi:MAG: peptidoglycan-binding domain-containing protein [Beijerinckiaceae bacterium]
MRKTARPEDFDLDFDDEDTPPREREPRRWFGDNKAARFGSAGLAALLFAIVVNAVFLQDQRHAAPLFKMSLRSAAPLDEPVAPPLPAPRPVELAAQPQTKAPPRNDAAPRIEVGRNDPIGRAIAQMDQQPPARVEKPKVADAKPVERTIEAKAPADSIGGLIRNVGAAPAPQAAEPDAGVMAAQRALMKLGFVIRPDGYMGGTTRQAIERFERDNRLPVRGELTARVKAELSKQSGVEIR